MTAATHVVFGTGPAGRAVASALVDQGARRGLRPRLASPEPGHPHHVQINFEVAFRVEQHGEFPHRHAVPHRQLVVGDERPPAGVPDRPLDGRPADRVRAVQDDDPQAVLLRRLQDEIRTRTT